MSWNIRYNPNLPASGNLIRQPGAGMLALSGRQVVVSSGFDTPSYFTPTGSLIYQSDFSEYANGEFIYGGAIAWNQLEPDSIYCSTNFGRISDRSARFDFGFGLPTKELDYNLQADYREVTFRWWVRWPSNFTHPNSPSSDNNKGIRVHSTDGYDTFNKIGWSYLPSANGTNYAAIYPEYTTIPTFDFTQHEPHYDNFIEPADFSVWTEYLTYVKAATAAGSGPAQMQVWKNGVKRIDITANNFDASEKHNYRLGYIFGAQDTNDEPTVPNQSVYMTDVQVWANT